jgi:glutathione S-transferase
MKFYDCETAGSPRRVRIFIAEKGLEIPTTMVDLRNGEQLGAEFRKLNPDCTVPVLELDDGTALSEVFAICQYLEALHPEPCLMGSDDRERALVSMWNGKVEIHGMSAVAEMFRNKVKGFHNRALTGPADFAQIPELVERGHARSLLFLDRMDRHFSENEYVIGNNFTLADITTFVATEFAGMLKLEIGDRPNLQRWYDLVVARPASNA